MKSLRIELMMDEPNSPDVSTIWRSVYAAYADCTTYEDHGSVETQYHSGMPTERPFTDKAENLMMAIAGATGVSSGSAYRVPAMLMPDLMSREKSHNYGDFRYVAAESIDGEMRDRVSQVAMSRKTDVWTSQSRSVIVRVQDQDTIGPNVSAVFGKGNAQLQSFSELLNWGVERFAGAMMAKMQPMPVTTVTKYRKVLVNQPLSDAVFTESGQGW